MATESDADFDLPNLIAAEERCTQEEALARTVQPEMSAPSCLEDARWVLELSEAGVAWPNPRHRARTPLARHLRRRPGRRIRRDQVATSAA